MAVKLLLLALHDENRILFRWLAQYQCIPLVIKYYMKYSSAMTMLKKLCSLTAAYHHLRRTTYNRIPSILLKYSLYIIDITCKDYVITSIVSSNHNPIIFLTIQYRSKECSCRRIFQLFR